MAAVGGAVCRQGRGVAEMAGAVERERGRGAVVHAHGQRSHARAGVGDRAGDRDIAGGLNSRGRGGDGDDGRLRIQSDLNRGGLLLAEAVRDRGHKAVGSRAQRHGRGVGGFSVCGEGAETGAVVRHADGVAGIGCADDLDGGDVGDESAAGQLAGGGRELGG